MPSEPTTLVGTIGDIASGAVGAMQSVRDTGTDITRFLDSAFGGEVPEWMGVLPRKRMIQHEMIYDTWREIMDDPNASEEDKLMMDRRWQIEQIDIKTHQERYDKAREEFLASGNTIVEQMDEDLANSDVFFKPGVPSAIRGLGQGMLSMGGNAVALFKTMAGKDATEDYDRLERIEEVNLAIDRLANRDMKEAGLPLIPGSLELAKASRRVTASLVEMAPSLGAGAVVRAGQGLSTTLMAGQAALTESGRSLNRAFGEGWSLGGSLAYATTMGAIEFGVTKGFSKLGPSMEESLAGIGKSTVGSTREAIGNALAAMFFEAGEEATIALFSSLADAATGMDPEALSPGRLGRALGESGLAGALGGGVASFMSLAGRTQQLAELQQKAPNTPIRKLIGFIEGLTAETDEPVSTSRQEFYNQTGIVGTGQEFREGYSQAAAEMSEYRKRLRQAVREAKPSEAEPGQAEPRQIAAPYRPEPNQPQVGPEPSEPVAMPGPPPKQLIDNKTSFDPDLLEEDLKQAKTAEFFKAIDGIRRDVIRHEFPNIPAGAKGKDLRAQLKAALADPESTTELDDAFDYLRSLAIEDPDMAAEVMDYAQLKYEEAYTIAKEQRAEYDEILKGYSNLRRKAREVEKKGGDYRSLKGLDELGEDIANRAPQLMQRLGMDPDIDNYSDIAYEALQLNVTEEFRLPQPFESIQDAVDEFEDMRQRQHQPAQQPGEDDFDAYFDQTNGDPSPQTAKQSGRKKAKHDDAEPSAPWSDLPAADIDVPAFPLKSLVNVPLPELLEMSEALSSMVKAIDLPPGLRGALFVRQKKILIALHLGGDPHQLAKTLAHEFGHLVESIPHNMIESDKHQNILGRLAWIKSYKEKFLAGWKGGPAPLNDTDRDRIKRQAEKEAQSYVSFETEIDEEITETTPLTPQDIKQIWNSTQPNLPEELIQYVKGLSDARKKAIVMQAMKGVVDEDLKRFENKKVVGTRKVKKKVTTDAGDVWIEARIDELIAEEIQKRRLIEAETVRNELVELSEWWRPYDKKEASRGHRKYRESGPELFADAMSVFFNAPGEVQARAPEFFRGLLGHFRGNPSVAKQYLELQGILQGDPAEYMDRRLERLKKAYERGDEIILADMNMRRRAQMSPLEVFQQEGFIAAMDDVQDKLGPAVMQSLINRSSPVLRAQDKGGAINSTVDKILAKEDNMYHEMEKLFRIDGPVQAYLSEMAEFVYKPLTDLGLTEVELAQLLFYRRSINDRERKINPDATTPEIASEQIDHLRKKMGEDRWQKLQPILHKFYDLNFAIMQQANEAGIISHEMMLTTVIPNSDSYATFAVLKHLESRVGWAIKQVRGTFEDNGNVYRTTVMKMVSVLRAAKLNDTKRRVIRHLYRDTEAGARLLQKNEKPKPGETRLQVLEDGKSKSYAVPEQYAALFDSVTDPSTNRVYGALSDMVYGVFYPLFIRYNPSFALRNLSRDAMSTWQRLGPVMDAVRKQRIQEMVDSGMSQEEAEQAAGNSFSMKHYLSKVWENIPAARRRALGEYDPKVTEMLRIRALDSSITSRSRHEAVAMFDDEATRELMERAGTLPRGESAVLKAKAYEALKTTLPTKLLGAMEYGATLLSVPNFIEMSEAAFKMGAYDMLKQEQYTDDQIAYILNNFAGTQNTRYKGINHPLVNNTFMFFSARMAGLRGHIQAAKANPKNYAARLAVTTIGDMMIMKLARLGAFTAGLATLMQLIPEEEEERNFIIPIMYTRDSGDGQLKAIYVALPRDFADSYAATMFNSLWDTVVTGQFPIDKVVEETKNATVGTLSPPLDIARMAYEYATMGDSGPIPVDSFYNRPIMSERDQAMGGWHARRKYIAWNLRKFGAVGEWLKPLTMSALGQDMQKNELTSLEKTFRSIPGLGSLIRVSNRGHTNKFYEQARQADEASNEVSRNLGQHTEKMRTVMSRANAIQDKFKVMDGVPQSTLGKEEQFILAAGKVFETDFYNPIRQAMLEAQRLGRTDEVRRLAETLETSAELYSQMMTAQRNGDPQTAQEAQRKLADFLAEP